MFAYTIIESNYKLEILRLYFVALRMTFIELFQLDKCQFKGEIIYEKIFT